ncbi:MAG: GNAT family N-acetyltransferase [Anaerolineae bacterium]|nr:GNAT family N-acetyltransferase [Anaerolineae bacterium]
MLTIRLAKNDDIPFLSEFWYDNMALLQQSNPRVRLLADARRCWEDAAQQFMALDEVIFFAAEIKGDVLGCIVGRIILNQAGLAPQWIGNIDWLILDLHSPHKQRGTGRALLQAMKDHFIDRHITQCQVSVSTQATVAQAFWLGVGAKKTDDIFWMNL